MAIYNIQNIGNLKIGGNFSAPPTRPIIPRKGNLPVGTYDSDIKKIEAVYDANGDIMAVDFFHELTCPDGSKIVVRFRYYIQELPALLDIFASYGLQGSIENAVGTKETIEVSEGENSSYMRISDRKLKLKTGGLLSSKRSPSRKLHSQAQNLLDDEEDDDNDDDDFADLDDDDFLDTTENED